MLVQLLDDIETAIHELTGLYNAVSLQARISASGSGGSSPDIYVKDEGELMTSVDLVQETLLNARTGQGIPKRSDDD